MKPLKRKGDGVFGTQIAQVKDLDLSYQKEAEELEENAVSQQKERERDGDESIYCRMQPFYRPPLEDLVDSRIDVLFELTLSKGEKVLRWCQGKVVKVYEESRDPIVCVNWDPCPDIEGSEEGGELDQKLLPSLWNKNVKGAWRMDVDIAIGKEEGQISLEGTNSKSETEESNSNMEFDSGDEDGTESDYL